SNKAAVQMAAIGESKNKLRVNMVIPISDYM
ncbi:MAG: hypothetical protein ACI846_003255, partial [Pseudoalteromonas distincta]